MNDTTCRFKRTLAEAFPASEPYAIHCYRRRGSIALRVVAWLAACAVIGYGLAQAVTP